MAKGPRPLRAAATPAVLREKRLSMLKRGLKFYLIVTISMTFVATRVMGQFELNLGALYLLRGLVEGRPIDVRRQPDQHSLELAEGHFQAAGTYLPQRELILELHSIALAVHGKSNALVNIWTSYEPAVRQIAEWERRAWRAREYRAAKRLDRWMHQSFPSLDVLPVRLQNQVLTLESFNTVERWFACSWCNTTLIQHGYLISDGQIAEMGYHNITLQRDHFGYLTRPELPISSFTTLMAHLRAEPGTLLTIEVVIDGQRHRVINYRPVESRWEIISVPISGKVLNELLISIGELEAVPIPDEYRLFVDWFALR